MAGGGLVWPCRSSSGARARSWPSPLSWAGAEPDGQPRDLSLNHYAFGAVDDWMYRHIAGPRPARLGSAEIEFASDLTGPLAAVSAAVETPHGPAGIE